MRKARLRPRLLPVVVSALAGLAGLKLLGIAAQGGYVFQQPQEARGFARALTEPRRNPLADEEITGASSAKKEDAKAGAAKPAPEAAKPGEPVAQPLPPQISPAERGVLEKLSERRQQLEHRAQELELREQLLKSAEKKIEERLGDIREADSRADAAPGAEAKATSPFKSLATIYEAMKPRDAAKVFEKMEARQLATLASTMNPRKLSEVMAQMSPESAEKLTSVLLRRQAAAGTAGEGNQPKSRPPELEDLPRARQ